MNDIRWHSAKEQVIDAAKVTWKSWHEVDEDRDVARDGLGGLNGVHTISSRGYTTCGVLVW